MTGPAPFPFASVVGNDDLKLALLLAAVDPGIGGVLLRGDKGSGKTTLVRGLAAVLPPGSPFVDLPLGATEDRVLGSLDLGAALAEGTERVRPGLLAAADGGVLYVDEVNLLADHLVDTLLDVAVSGRHRLERDGVSVVQPARFVLVGTMNPEEGELRPQLLDRFGLCVTVVAPTDPVQRAEIVRRRLAFDAGVAPEGPGAGDEDLSARLAAARPAAIPDDVVAFAARLALAVGAEGLRADLVLCRAAAALAGWEDRDETTTADVERVAPLVLAHRRRRTPSEPPVLPPDELADALDEARSGSGADDGGDGRGPDGSPPGGCDGDHGGDDGPDGPEDDGQPPAGGSERPGAGDGSRPVVLGVERPGVAPTPPAARRTAAVPGRGAAAGPGPRGRQVRDVPFGGDDGELAVVATVRNVARRRAADPTAGVERADLRAPVREDRAAALVVVALDVSGSMGVEARVAAATGAVLGLLTGAYQRRDRVAVVTFGGGGATVALAPTGSIEVARARLASLATGGTTPLAAGLRTALGVATARPRPGAPPPRATLVVVTDGRATGPDGGSDDALAAAGEVRAAGVPALVLDAETGTPRLGLAARLAGAMGAPCRPVADLGPETLRAVAAGAVGGAG